MNSRYIKEGDWGLGIGDWANPQSPIPNPPSPSTFNEILYNLSHLL